MANRILKQENMIKEGFLRHLERRKNNGKNINYINTIDFF